METGNLDLCIARTLASVLEIAENTVGEHPRWLFFRKSVLKHLNAMRNDVVLDFDRREVASGRVICHLLDLGEATFGDQNKWPLLRKSLLNRLNNMREQIVDNFQNDKSGTERKGTGNGNHKRAYQ